MPSACIASRNHQKRDFPCGLATGPQQSPDNRPYNTMKRLDQEFQKKKMRMGFGKIKGDGTGAHYHDSDWIRSAGDVPAHRAGFAAGNWPPPVRWLAPWSPCPRRPGYPRPCQPPGTHAIVPMPLFFMSWSTSTTRRSLRPWNRTAARCPPSCSRSLRLT